MTPFDVLEIARLLAKAVPGQTMYVLHPPSGYEVLALDGHEPVVVAPPGPYAAVDAVERAR